LVYATGLELSSPPQAQQIDPRGLWKKVNQSDDEMEHVPNTNCSNNRKAIT
jgi:hypothetical protein